MPGCWDAGMPGSHDPRIPIPGCRHAGMPGCCDPRIRGTQNDAWGTQNEARRTQNEAWRSQNEAWRSQNEAWGTQTDALGTQNEALRTPWGRPGKIDHFKEKNSFGHARQLKFLGNSMKFHEIH